MKFKKGTARGYRTHKVPKINPAETPFTIHLSNHWSDVSDPDVIPACRQFALQNESHYENHKKLILTSRSDATKLYFTNPKLLLKTTQIFFNMYWFPRICGFHRMSKGHKYFQFRQSPDQTNDIFFLKFPQNLHWDLFWVFSIKWEISWKVWFHHSWAPMEL